MIERVAKAMEDRAARNPCTLEDVARAAIEAMREPTIEMVESIDIEGETDAGGGINATYSIGSEGAKKVWQAMIDAALEGK